MRKWETMKAIYRIWVSYKMTVVFKANFLRLQEIKIGHELILFSRYLTIIIVRISGIVKRPTHIGRPLSEASPSWKVRANSPKKENSLRQAGQLQIGLGKASRPYVVHAWGVVYFSGFLVCLSFSLTRLILEGLCTCSVSWYVLRKYFTLTLLMLEGLYKLSLRDFTWTNQHHHYIGKEHKEKDYH